MPKTSTGDIVICVGRESIEALASGEPVNVGDNEYLLRADSYDFPYRRIAELEEACEASWNLGHKIYHNANAHEATSIDWPATRKLLAKALGKDSASGYGATRQDGREGVTWKIGNGYRTAR